MRMTFPFCALFAVLATPLLPGIPAASAETAVVTLEEQVVTDSPDTAQPGVYASLPLSIEAHRLPLTASVLPASLMRMQGNTTLRDALRNIPGSTVGVGNGVHDFFAIRGIDSLNGGLVLIDGVPEPEATFYLLNDIEEVQVIRGPLTFAHGPGATGASVNMIRKQPRAETFMETRLGFGSHDTLQAGIDAGTFSAEGNSSSRLNAFFRDAESHRNNISGRFRSVSPALTWQPDPDGSLTLQLNYTESDVTPDPGIPLLGSLRPARSRSANYSRSGDYSEQEIVRVAADYMRTLDDHVHLRNRTYYTHFDWKSRGTVYAGYAAFGAGLEPAPLTLARYGPELDDAQRILGNELTLTFEKERHELVAGIEATRFEDDFLITTPSATDINTVSGLESPGRLLPPVPDNAGDTQTDLIGISLMDQITLNDRMSLTAGARADWMDFEDSLRGDSRSETLVSPFAGLSVSASENVTWFATAARGYNPPSTRVTGPRGDAEEADSIEGGIRFTCPQSAWQAGVSAYRLERNHIAIPGSTGLFSDSGEQVSRGAEAELRGPLSDSVSLILGYAYLDSELTSYADFGPTGVEDRSGKTAPFSPEHVLQAWAEITCTEALVVGLGGRAVSDQYTAPDNAYEIDAHTVLDAAVSYRTADWGVTLNLYNLTGEYYEGRGTAGSSVIPEDDFSAMITLSTWL